MAQFKEDIEVDGSIQADTIIKKNSSAKEFLKGSGEVDTDVLRNSVLDNYYKITNQELTIINTEIQAYYDRVLADGGTIENYLSVDDFIPQDTNSGIIVRDIIRDVDGRIVTIELDFLKVEDLPVIPASLIANNDEWTTLEW